MEITSEIKAPDEAIPPRLMPLAGPLPALGAPSSAPARVLKMLMVGSPSSLLYPDHSAIAAGPCPTREGHAFCRRKRTRAPRGWCRASSTMGRAEVELRAHG